MRIVELAPGRDGEIRVGGVIGEAEFDQRTSQIAGCAEDRAGDEMFDIATGTVGDVVQIVAAVRAGGDPAGDGKHGQARLGRGRQGERDGNKRQKSESGARDHLKFLN